MISRRVFVLSAPLALAGCGYRPLYAKVDGADVAAKLSGIAVEEQRTRFGQLVRNELISTMSPPGSGGPDRFRLNLTVREAVTFVSHLPASRVDRYRYRLNAAYELVPIDGKKAASRGSTFSAVSYDTVREPVADLQARDAAMERAAIELAQDIRLRLSAFLAS